MIPTFCHGLCILLLDYTSNLQKNKEPRICYALNCTLLVYNCQLILKIQFSVTDTSMDGPVWLNPHLNSEGEDRGKNETYITEQILLTTLDSLTMIDN